MPHLTIDISAIRANYAALKTRVGNGCTVSAVVKANAYGLGVGPVSEALYEEGCRLFFVATLPEALELRLILGETPVIAMLGGYEDENAALYTQSNITPVLNHAGELTAYKTLAAKMNQTLPAIIHIDTGMNRLGFDAETIQTLAADVSAFAGLKIHCVMSHFACADQKDAPMTADQYDTFTACVSALPGLPKSICNSSGLMRESKYHLDIVRPGMALYGLNPTPEAPNPMQPVLKLDAPVLQIREAKAGEVCGYNATYRFDENTSLAIVPIGYADGFMRALSNQGTLYWNGIPCPVRGRVSMDLTIVDLGALPDADMPKPGDCLEVIGPHQSADDIAVQAGTIGYEILTSFSRRYKRIYV